MVREHHQRVINRLIERFGEDPRYPALIIGGSVAKERARDDSDVDVVFIGTDEEWERRKVKQEYFWYMNDLCDYPKGYVDAKVVNLQFLLDAAERGSEPTRSSFFKAFVAYSRIPELETVLERIPVYQEHEQKEKIETFVSQMRLLSGFFTHEAARRNDPYLRAQTCANLALFGGRLILAHNKILFPGHKWYMTELEKAPEKPEGFMGLICRVLEEPGPESAAAFRESLLNFRDWGVVSEPVGRFIEDAEWNWRKGRPPIQDW